MANFSELSQQVSRQVLENFLQIRGEGDNFDFKRSFSLSLPKAKVELTRDILAFANTEGGGHIIFGIEDKTYSPVGLQEQDSHLDTTTLYKALQKYLPGDLQFVAAEYEIQWSEWPDRRRFGLLYVTRYQGIAMPKCDVSYYDGKEEIRLVKATDILTRRGAQSCHVETATLNRLLGERPDSLLDQNEEQAQPLDDNLPPREEITVEFVGRREELIGLENWFKDPARKRWLLLGYGGKGKTAIAYEFATRVKAQAPKHFAYVLWLSAKERQFLEGVIEDSHTPDFWDKESLLDAIVRGYGFNEYLGLPLDEKRDKAVELLTSLPALLIADDIDSLSGENEDAIEFLISDIASTPSKILLTSRRPLFGFYHITTEVSGLKKEDGEQFVQTRIRLLGLDRDSSLSRFSPRKIEEILQVTEGSPLYIEDLLRLCRHYPVDEAIADWKQKGGDKAREYALKREFDLLTPFAKETVFACCLPQSSVSLSELQIITDKPRDQIKSELATIQNLFLVSRPKLIDGEERYDVNTNMRLLVLHTFEKSDVFKRMRKNYEGQFGRLNTAQKNDIASYIRNAIAKQRLGNDNEAENLLKSALAIYPNNPDLIAELGIVYYYWRPRRIADARQQFERAKQLGCKRERMYEIWATMETIEKEWTAGFTTAEAGINAGNQTRELYYLAGYAHSRHGQYLKRSFHPDLSKQELLVADNFLRKALKDPEHLADFSERKRNSRIFRALVINCMELGHFDDMRDYLDDMHYYIERWQREHPGDEQAFAEGERLKAMHPRPS